MSFKIVLTILPFANHVYTPPVQLAYLKSYLEQDKDVQVKTLDLEIKCFHSALIQEDAKIYWQKMWEDPVTSIPNHAKAYINRMIDKILEEKPQVVGFSVSSWNYAYTNYCAQILKNISPDIFIIYGGRRFCLKRKYRNEVADSHKELPFVDCIVKNEGEATLSEIITILKSGKTPSRCPGATIRFQDRINDGGERPLITDLNTIPFPDFTDFNCNDYLANYIRILFSRGCYGRCSYCVENDYMGDTVRYRSPQNIVEEIKFRIQQGYRSFQICDLCVNSMHRPLIETCKLIIKERLDISFVFGEFRHSHHLNKEALDILKRAGFERIAFGTESYSQRILNKMKKGIKASIIDQNIRDVHESGIEVILYLMVGFPGETEETFCETLDLLKNNKNFIDAVSFAAPTAVCPGSDIYEQMDLYKIKPESAYKDAFRWESTDEKNTYKWRLNLSKRVKLTMAKYGIPLVDHTLDGNPRIPLLAKRVLTTSPDVQHVQSSHPDPSSPYQAEIILCTPQDFRYAIFLLKITNTGSCTWLCDEKDFFRVGCRIFQQSQNTSRTVLELRDEFPKKKIEPGEYFYSTFSISKNLLPKKGIYEVIFDIVKEHKFWFADQGGTPFVELIQT
jgi:radical SAM superfamily enzyme YgiQ (UPF0313 family)